MTDLRKAAEMALEALEVATTPLAKDRQKVLAAVTALRAALVAAEKEQQMIRDGYRKCAEGQRTTQFCGLLDAAVKAERKACAKVCEEWGAWNNVAQDCAAAIRARGEK